MTGLTRRQLLHAGSAIAVLGVQWIGAPEHDRVQPGLTVHPASDTNSTSDAFTVGTYNIRYQSFWTAGDPIAQKWEERRDAAARCVIEAGCSLLALQEVSFIGAPSSQAVDFARVLTAQSGSTWVAAEASRMQAFVYDTGVMAITSSVELEDVLVTYPRPGQQRVVVWATFEHQPSATSFAFIGSHFPINDDAPPWGRRMTLEAAQRVTARALALNAEGHSVVVAADYNDAQVAPWNLAQHGFPDTRQETAGPRHARFNSFNNWQTDMAGRQRGIWIDRISTSPDLSVRDVGLAVEFANGASLPLAEPIGSDHFLLFAQLTARELHTDDGGIVLPLTLPAVVN